jgi:hypothetical protein
MHAHLDADHAPGDQQECEHDVDRLIGRGVKESCCRRHEQDLELRVPMTTFVGIRSR